MASAMRALHAARRFVRRIWPGSTKIRADRLYRTYCDLGEDLVILDLLALGEPSALPREGRYLDLGCYEPIQWSATARLYEQGWTGVAVDADGQHGRTFKALRPKDKFVASAVTADGREVSFAFNEKLGSADPKWASRFGEPTREVQMPSTTPRRLVEEHFSRGGLQLLAIDVEGLDAEVLGAFPFDFCRPQVVMVELHVLFSDALANHPSVKAMRAIGYRVGAHNRRNVFFVDEDWYRAGQAQGLGDGLYFDG